MRFLARMNEQSRLRRINDGFEYAAGCLLKEGQNAVTMLEYHVEEMRGFHEYTPFEEGVEAAIKKYEELVK